jgi:hypothetical protein
VLNSNNSSNNSSSNIIKVGDAYRFVFGGPGADVTVLIVTRIKNERVDAYDVNFKIFVHDIEIDKLWQPNEWCDWELENIKEGKYFLDQSV